MARMVFFLVWLVVIAGFCHPGVADDDIWECKVRADEDWQSSGARLSARKTYLLTAGGTWTTSDGSKYKKTNPFGPGGGGATSGLGIINFKVNKSFALGCLMADVGGKEYEIGCFGAICPRLPGSLRLRMNDTALSDNEGEVHVTVIELSSEEAARFTKGFRVRPNLGKGDPNSGWQKSNISLRSGEKIEIEFYGKWTTSPYTGIFGPEGGGKTEDLGSDFAKDFRLVPDIAVGALIGRVGRAGRPFAVNPKGKETIMLTADTSGDLYFNINDKMQIDNGGTIVVVPVSD